MAIQSQVIFVACYSRTASHWKLERHTSIAKDEKNEVQVKINKYELRMIMCRHNCSFPVNYRGNWASSQRFTYTHIQIWSWSHEAGSKIIDISRATYTSTCNFNVCVRARAHLRTDCNFNVVTRRGSILSRILINTLRIGRLNFHARRRNI